MNEAGTAKDAIAASVAPAVTSAAADALHDKTTGPNVGASAPSAIRDFLPRLAAALVAPGVSDDPSALDFRFNQPMNEGIFDFGFTLQGGVTFGTAEPFGALIDSIPASIRESSRTRLAEGLGQFDDAKLFAAANVENTVVGRAFAPFRRDVDALAREIVGGAAGAAGADAVTAYETLRDRIDRSSVDPDKRGDAACTAAFAGPGIRLDRLPMYCLKPDVRAGLEAVLPSAAAAEGQRQLRIAGALRSSGFIRISELINNQPQVNATAAYQARSEVVGPAEFTGQLRMEMGFANMNALRSHCRGMSTSTITEACLGSFLGQPSVIRSLNRGDRLWAALDFRRQPDYRIDLPDDSVSLELDASTSYALSGGYGAYVGQGSGEERDRLDLQVRHDFSDGDGPRQSRWVATALYSLRLSDASSAIVGLTWANRAEYVGDVNRRFGANLGVTYKISPKETAEEQQD